MKWKIYLLSAQVFVCSFLCSNLKILSFWKIENYRKKENIYVSLLLEIIIFIYSFFSKLEYDVRESSLFLFLFMFSKKTTIYFMFSFLFISQSVTFVITKLPLCYGYIRSYKWLLIRSYLVYCWSETASCFYKTSELKNLAIVIWSNKKLLFCLFKISILFENLHQPITTEGYFWNKSLLLPFISNQAARIKLQESLYYLKQKTQIIYYCLLLLLLLQFMSLLLLLHYTPLFC